MAKQSKLFLQIEQVWNSDSKLTTKTKPDSVYMTARFLSLDPDGFWAASDLNRCIGMHPSLALPFLKCNTPRMGAPRNKYPKKLTKEKKLPPKKQKALDRICKKFAVTEVHGRQILTLLEQQGKKLEA